MTGISVVTIVKGRKDALRNTMQGLKEGIRLPSELIVIHMNEERYPLEPMPFLVHREEFISSVPLPLAAARNKGMSLAKSNKVVFLHVDCIPSPRFLKSYVEQWEENYLHSGEIRYLSHQYVQNYSLFDNLDAYSRPDALRSGLTSIPYELFWSLNFGCDKTVFKRIGGFDEGFKGYGAEDTDFAFTAREKNIAIKSVTARAYHQYHDSFSTPENHLADIVRNANYFFAKWNTWPMEGWLSKFREMGLVYWDESSLELIRQPSEEEILRREN